MHFLSNNHFEHNNYIYAMDYGWTKLLFLLGVKSPWMNHYSTKAFDLHSYNIPTIKKQKTKKEIKIEEVVTID